MDVFQPDAFPFPEKTQKSILCCQLRLKHETQEGLLLLQGQGRGTLFHAWSRDDSDPCWWRMRCFCRDVGNVYLIEKFVCQLYVPRTYICTVKELRWWVAVSKEASPVREATTNPSCKSSNLNSSLSTSSVKLWRGRQFHSRNLWLDSEWKLMGACHDETTYNTRYRRNYLCSAKRCQCRKAWTKLHRFM